MQIYRENTVVLTTVTFMKRVTDSEKAADTIVDHTNVAHDIVAGTDSTLKGIKSSVISEAEAKQ